MNALTSLILAIGLIGLMVVFKLSALPFTLPGTFGRNLEWFLRVLGGLLLCSVFGFAFYAHVTKLSF